MTFYPAVGVRGEPARWKRRRRGKEREGEKKKKESVQRGGSSKDFGETAPGREINQPAVRENTVCGEEGRRKQSKNGEETLRKTKRWTAGSRQGSI